MADRFSARLAAEIRSWIRDGLVSAQQGDAILARYPVERSWFARPVALLSLVGGALIAAGLALVISHNWEEIHRWVKLGGLVVLMGAAHLGGLAARDRGYPLFGEGLFVVGGGLLLLGISLIGQTYNLSGRPSDALLLWWALLLPSAYALPSLALASLGFLGAVAWYVQMLWDPSTLLGQGVLQNDHVIAIAVAVLGMALFGFGMLHGDGHYRRLRQLLEQLGLLALFVGLLPFGFFWRTEWDVGRGLPPGLLVGLLALGAVGIVISAWQLRQDAHGVRIGLPVVLLVLLVYLAAVAGAIALQAPQGIFRMLGLLNWFLLFGASLAFILYGARWDRTSWINWGVVFIGVHAVARYVDLFGTMLQTSALFFTAGGFVLLLGWGLERMRRQMSARAAERREAT